MAQDDMLYGQIHGIDKPIPRLIQGSIMISSDDIPASFALMDAIFAQGGNAFDLAHVYGKGDNERTFGRWLHERGNRDQIVIITKGAHHNEDRQRVTPFDITSDLHDSLARLGVDHIDLYMLHRDDPRVPVEPIVDILNKHQRAGLIGAFGASNWTYARIEEANQYAHDSRQQPFVFSSPQFSLAEQLEEPWDNCVSISGPSGEAARAWYREQALPLFTWSSLAGGFFSGRFRRDNLDSFEAYLDQLCVKCYCHEDNFKRLDRAHLLATKHGVSLPQIALAYVMAQPLDIYALVGCRTREEFAANIAALHLGLSPEEVAWLDLRTDQLHD